MKRTIFALLTIALYAGCAGSGAKAPSKAPAKSEQPAAPGTSAKAEAPEEPESQPGRSASELLLLPDQMYSLAFSSSEAGEKAEERCSKHNDNPKRHNECMKRERAKIDEDVLHFQKDDGGRLYWITSSQHGNKLTRKRKVEFTIVKETPDSVEIKLKGQGKSVTIGVPNEYSIEVPSPKYGKLVYESKVDIAAAP